MRHASELESLAFLSIQKSNAFVLDLLLCKDIDHLMTTLDAGSHRQRDAGLLCHTLIGKHFRSHIKHLRLDCLVPEVVPRSLCLV